MFSFKSYLTEAKEEDKLKHLEHVEDHVIHGGSEGFAHAFHTLNDVHGHLTGQSNKTKITTKYDGSPSVVFGTDPKTGKFFVGSKSVFNKNPKINYTEKDIEKNHGHAPGLVEKLKAALKHLPKIHDGKGIYQADIMHAGDVTDKGHRVEYTPNTITYHHDAKSPDAQKALKAKLGVAVHTKYAGTSLDNMVAKHGEEFNLQDHEDVHVMPIQHDLSKVHYPLEAQKQYQQHVKSAMEHYKKMPKEGHQKVMDHAVPIKTYINQTVRTGEKPSHKGFHQHFKASLDKKIAGVKTDAAKAKHTTTRDKSLGQVKANKAHIESALAMHHHLQQAKNILTDALSSHSTVGHEIGGMPTKPEGFVVHKNGRPSKFVLRHEFSAANFARGDALKGNK